MQPAGRVHLSRRLRSYEEIDSEVRLNFTDGTTATCDLLIGTDGIRSTVRRKLLEKQVTAVPATKSLTDGLQLGDPVWSGTYAYRGLVPFDRLAARFPGHRALTTPIMVSLHALQTTNDIQLNVFIPKYTGKLKVSPYLYTRFVDHTIVPAACNLLPPSTRRCSERHCSQHGPHERRSRPSTANNDIVR